MVLQLNFNFKWSVNHKLSLEHRFLISILENLVVMAKQIRR
mgnify:CR=1 FL=1